MKKILFFFLSLVLSFTALSQSIYDSSKVLQENNAYGFDFKNVGVRGILKLSRDTTKLAMRDSGSIAYVNRSIYFWDGYKWNPSAKKLNDSTFIVGNDTMRISGSGAGGGGADGNNYPTGITFNAITKALAIQRTGLADISTVIPLATTSGNGLMDSTSKKRLDSNTYYKNGSSSGYKILYGINDTLFWKNAVAKWGMTLDSLTTGEVGYKIDSATLRTWILTFASGGGGSTTITQALANGRTLPTNDSIGFTGKYFKFYANSSNVTTEGLYIGKRQFDNATNSGWYPLVIEPMSTDARAPNWYWKLNQTAQTGTYPNNVMKMGWNPDLIQSNKMGLWDAYESYYSPGGGTDSILERHISFQGQGTGEVRLASWTVYMRNGILGDNQTTNIFSNLDIRAETTNFLTTNNRSFASIAQNKSNKVSAFTLQSGNGVALNLSVDSAQNLISFNQQFGPSPRAVSFFNDGNTRDLNFYNFRVTTNAGVEFQGYAGVNTDSTHDFGGYATRWKRFYAGQVGMNRQLVGNLSAWGNHFLSGELIKHTPYADDRSVFMRMTNAAGSSTIHSILNDGTMSIPTGGYDYSRSVWQPSLTFAGRDTTGMMLHTGNVITFVDRGSKIAGFYKEGDASYLQFYATNRGMISSESALVFNANNSHYEFEGLGDWRLSIVGYGTGSSQGKTIVYETDPVLSVTPLGAMGRNNVPSLKLYDSLYRTLSFFDMKGNLRIGDTTYTGNAGIHVASNMTSSGNEQIILRDQFNLTNRWGIAKENAYTEDLVFNYNGAEKGGFTNTGKLFVGLHNPDSYNLSVLGIGRIRNTAASDAEGAVMALEGTNLSNQSFRMVYNPSGTPTTIWEMQGNFNTGEIRNFIKAGGGYFHTWYSNGAKSMTLHNNGNLSIGNTDNSYKLNVTGDINLTGALRVSGTPGTTGQVLVSNGASAPSWQSVTSSFPWNVAGVDSANTTNATSTTVKTIVIPDASRGIIEVWMDCIGTDDGTKGLTGIKRVRYKKTGGTLTLGTVEDEMAILPDGGLTSATFTITTSSNNIIIQVTGEAATNLKWKPTYRMTNNAIAL